MQVEKLDRALVAVHTSKGNFLSWRWLPSDPANYAFRLYRDGKLLGELTQTNYTGTKGSTSSQYKVEVVDEKKSIIDQSAVLDKKPLTDSIVQFSSEDLQPASATYNLLGQRVNEHKGIVIKKGKKWASR